MSGNREKGDAGTGAKTGAEGWKQTHRPADVATGPKRPPAPINKKERPASKGRVHKGRTRA